jgi:hypothetical protein
MRRLPNSFRPLECLIYRQTDEHIGSSSQSPEVTMNAITATVAIGLGLRVLVPLVVVFLLSAALRRWQEGLKGA